MLATGVLLLAASIFAGPLHAQDLLAQEQYELLRDPPFRIAYAPRDQELAARTRQILQEALAEYKAHLPVGDEPIEVYLPSTPQVWRQMAGKFSVPTVGGFARSEEGIIVVKVPRIQQDPTNFRSILRHELVHVLLARNTDPDHLPKWFNEGIAMMLAGEHTFRGPLQIGNMYVRGQVMDYPDLMLVLEGAPGELQFGHAYAQSLSMTRYLKDELGEETFWEFVHSLREQEFHDALEAYTGWIPYEFWRSWYNSLWLYALLFSIFSSITLMQIMALLAILAFWRKRRRNQRILDRWEDDEAVLLPSEVLPDGELYDWELDDDDDDDEAEERPVSNRWIY